VANQSNINTLAAYAWASKLLGLEEQGNKAAEAIIDFYQGDQMARVESMVSSYKFHLAVTHALLGNRELAIDYFSRIAGSNYISIWWIDAVRMTGAFDDIRSDPVYIETLASLRNRNVEILANLRDEVPEVFDVPSQFLVREEAD